MSKQSNTPKPELRKADDIEEQEEPDTLSYVDWKELLPQLSQAVVDELLPLLTSTICFSESFASLSKGLQAALWQLGGVPRQHRTDCLTAAVNLESPEEFTRRCQGLLAHYDLQGVKGQPGHGDVEQRHRRFKETLEQDLNCLCANSHRVANFTAWGYLLG